MDDPRKSQAGIIETMVYLVLSTTSVSPLPRLLDILYASTRG